MGVEDVGDKTSGYLAQSGDDVGMQWLSVIMKSQKSSKLLSVCHN